VCLSDKG